VSLHSRLKARIGDPIVVQLTQGLSAEKLALTVAVGICIAVNPVIGTTTILCFFAACLAGPAMGQPPAKAARPEAIKVEPPSWWPGHSINPVRVLIKGRNLAGARIEGASAGLVAGAVKVNEAGTWLFADVTIDPKAEPGPRKIRIRTAGGMVEAPFELLAPLPREGRFQGFSPDDVIYLIMPDRFDDGDPTNDDPAAAKGLFDRAKDRYYHGGDLQGIIDRLPYLKDAVTLAQNGFITGASGRNWKSYENSIELPAGTPEWQRQLFCDPQTSGGLLVACAPSRADELLKTIIAAGYPEARIVGQVVEGKARVLVESP
jgi:hypothetical protein